MELKQIALTLGLPETADEATVNAKLAELKSSKDEVEKMRKENDDLKLAQITAAVDAAVAAKKINADQKTILSASAKGRHRRSQHHPRRHDPGGQT